MEMKLQSENLHQHVMNALYRDKLHCDTVLRVDHHSYHCHAALLASSSHLLRAALRDCHLEQLQDQVTIVLAGWSQEEAELYVKQTYNQVELLVPEELVKVESVLTFKVCMLSGCLFVLYGLFQERDDTKNEPLEEYHEEESSEVLDDYNDNLDTLDPTELEDPSFSKEQNINKMRSKKKKKSSVSNNLTEESGSGYLASNLKIFLTISSVRRSLSVL